MGRSVPVKYMDLGSRGIAILQDFFWVLMPEGRTDAIYSANKHLMIFSSKEKAASAIGNFVPKKSILRILFRDEIIKFSPKCKRAVLDYSRSADRPCIWIDFTEDEEKKTIREINR